MEKEISLKMRFRIIKLSEIFGFCILRAKSDLLLALGTLRFRIKERRSQRNRWFRCSSQVVLGMGVGAEKQKQNPNVLALLDSLLPPFLESFSNCSRILSIRNKLTTSRNPKGGSPLHSLAGPGQQPSVAGNGPLGGHGWAPRSEHRPRLEESGPREGGEREGRSATETSRGPPQGLCGGGWCW